VPTFLQRIKEKKRKLCGGVGNSEGKNKEEKSISNDILEKTEVRGERGGTEKRGGGC